MNNQNTKSKLEVSQYDTVDTLIQCLTVDNVFKINGEIEVRYALNCVDRFSPTKGCTIDKESNRICPNDENSTYTLREYVCTTYVNGLASYGIYDGGQENPLHKWWSSRAEVMNNEFGLSLHDCDIAINNMVVGCTQELWAKAIKYHYQAIKEMCESKSIELDMTRFS